ncbi:GRIM-19 protein-domain-containing protein [Suillus subaureus]|uniref:GRIM-19 protein-domain-containing protein n=1 Tax=Suillus subaureus TaxID=48587 RepID=A0A9P7EAY9_9AGAM|nr:GRIM-19 protein-domain-containing protein [Suillus subaureus]KAG1815659.1 GRIM-19 protein-domain-containing protein [Suillus subaureus]
MPPPGGFEAVKYKRNLPFRGPSGLVILGAVTAVCAYGFYRVGMGNLERRELQREQVWSRIHLVPLLVAEGDRDAYRRQQAALEREREIMKDVKGWENHNQLLDLLATKARSRRSFHFPPVADGDVLDLRFRRDWRSFPIQCNSYVHIKQLCITQFVGIFLRNSSYDMLSPDADQLIFGPLEFDEGPLLSPSMAPSWDSPNDFGYHHPLSPPTSDHTPSPHHASDFDVTDASPNNSFYDSTFGRASFSPSEFAAPHQLPRSLSPADGSDGYLSSPGLRVESISPAETSLRPPPWATQLWDSSHYETSTSSARVHQPLSEHPYGVKRQRFQPRRDLSTLGFQSSSAPMQTSMPSMMRNYSSRRGESVSVSDDRDATVRRKKRLSTDELSREEKSADSPPLKSILKQPKLAPSAWQLYFTDWIQRHQATSTRKLNVAQAAKEAGQEYASLTPEEKEPYKRRSAVLKEVRERENAAYMRSLTPDDIKKENAFRTAQRKAGRSRKSNIKDPNAPKKPLSAYFMFLQRIRSDRALVREIFGDEQETTKQSVLAAAKWRSMTDDERKPFLAQAEQEKLEYEAARRLYEEGTTDLGTSINFSILPSSPNGESPFRALRAIQAESLSSESESEGIAADDGAGRYTRI